MKKLNNLSIALKGLGLTAESTQINKIAREYLSRVVSDNLSGKFYSIVRELESRLLFSWSTDTFEVLLQDAYRRHPETMTSVTKLSVQICFADWCEEYASSIGSDDTGIPPWLFNFSEEKIFPILKESFSNCIHNLPADSATKAGLQDWLSQTTISQLGASNLASTLDGGAEFWSNIISNMVHQMHHNILNPSAWKRFSTLGNDEAKYNLLDGLEEGLAATVLNLPDRKDNQKADALLASVVANSMAPIIENIIPMLKRSYNYGEILVKEWSKIYDHLDQINLEEMGIKDSNQKMVFLKRVLDTALDNNDLSTLRSIGEFSKILSLSVEDVWSEKTYGTNDYKWDFLTGDDETLLIELMKDLDSKADFILQTWEAYQSTAHKVALEATRDCIDQGIIDGLAELES